MKAIDAIIPVVVMFAADLVYERHSCSTDYSQGCWHRSLFLLRWQLEHAPKSIRLEVGKKIRKRIAREMEIRKEAGLL